MSSLPKCTMPGCPQRYRGGPDRPCPDHQPAADDWLTRLTAFGTGTASQPGFPISKQRHCFDGQADGGDGDHVDGDHGGWLTTL